MLKQLSFFFFFTNNEALSAVGNSYSVIPQNLMYKEGTNKTRNEIIQEILSNDPRRKKKKKTKKKRGPAPRCRACRTVQNEDELTVTVKALYSSLRTEFRHRSNLLFLSETAMHNTHAPYWTN